MHHKISALTLSLLITGYGFALELIPREQIIQQEAAQTAKGIENGPIQRLVTTQFGKIESKLSENKEARSKKIELIVKQKVYNKTGLLALGGGAILALATRTPMDKWHYNYANDSGIAIFTIALGFVCLVKTIASSANEEQYHEATINLEKNERGNWVVVNSAYDQKMNTRLAKAAAAIENNGIDNSKVFEKLEKIFAQQS